MANFRLTALALKTHPLKLADRHFCSSNSQTMESTPPRRSPFRGLLWLRCRALPGLLLLATAAAAQSPANAPASVPAGAEPAAAAPSPPRTQTLPSLPARQLREADDAYLKGAKAVERKDLAAAEESFARAHRLNPRNRDYALALAVTREQHLTDLVQSAAKARLLGDTARADALLAQARSIDPENPVVAQHFGLSITPRPEPVRPLGNAIAASLANAVELAPAAGKQTFHLRGGVQDILRSIYSSFGIRASFDPSVSGYKPIKLDLEDVTFEEATRIASEMTHTFAVPVQPHAALLASDTPDNRDRLLPQIEETVYMPGLAQEQMSEMANLARTVFDLKSVTASSSTDTIVLRGDPRMLRALNATYDGMLSGSSDVMLDVNLYEMDRARTRNLGLQLPTSVGAFSVTAEASQLVNANQSIIDEAIANGLIKLTGNTVTDLITEVGFLVASGTVNVAQYSNLLGIFGNGLSLAGLYVGSGATLNVLLNSSDVRTLDAVKLRAGDNQASTFRAGTRYPIITSTYTSGISSSLASSVSGLNINGTSVGSLLQQYLGTSSVTVPQVQFEDLGLTLKATPQIQHDGSVQIKLDMKIESLGAGSLNSIPVLNNRQLTSTVTIPAGETALMASEVSSSETREIQGLPGLGDLPGFQQAASDTSRQKSTGELLITITPHIVREEHLQIAGRALLVPHSTESGGEARFYEPPPEAPPTTPTRAPATQRTPTASPSQLPSRQPTAPTTTQTPK